MRNATEMSTLAAQLHLLRVDAGCIASVNNCTTTEYSLFMRALRAFVCWHAMAAACCRLWLSLYHPSMTTRLSAPSWTIIELNAAVATTDPIELVLLQCTI